MKNLMIGLVVLLGLMTANADDRRVDRRDQYYDYQDRNYRSTDFRWEDRRREEIRWEESRRREIREDRRREENRIRNLQRELELAKSREAAEARQRALHLSYQPQHPGVELVKVPCLLPSGLSIDITLIRVNGGNFIGPQGETYTNLPTSVELTNKYLK